MGEIFLVVGLVLLAIGKTRSILPDGSADPYCPEEALVEVTPVHDYPEEALRRRGDKVFACPCQVRPCLPLCCLPDPDIPGLCAPSHFNESWLPTIHDPITLAPGDFQPGHFHTFTWDHCHGGDKYRLEPDSMGPEDEYILLANGSIYRPFAKILHQYTEYCLRILPGDDFISVVLCFGDPVDAPSTYIRSKIYTFGMIFSSVFLAATFIVYSIMPELNNMHGLTLRGYIGSLVIAYLLLAILNLTPQNNISDISCFLFAYIVHFSFLASFFWLNVMCFDIWWTFGGFRSMQGSIKQRDRKKFILYSIYAWGSASVLTVICMIMDFVPTIPKHIIRPEFGVGSCWFKNDTAKAIYFYGPMGVTVVCNICLFILTALKILRHKKDTAQHLKTSESRRHDDNKQWFNLYLKLFIVMGINWSMEIISWLGQDLPEYIWYLPDLTNTLQGVIIFIIFVWKDKIKRLLLKRLGCENRRFMSRQSTRSGERSGSSRTCASAYPLQEKSNQYTDSYRAKSNTTTTEESDCL